MIKFVKPTGKLVEQIALTMRKEDALEVYLSHGKNPFDSLMDSWRISDYSVIITDDDTPLCMYGLVKTTIMTGAGVPWMLSSTEVLKHVKTLLPKSKDVVAEMLTVCTRLSNHVHCDNKMSIRWLKWLGFTMEEPQFYGVHNELFHRFNLERS